MTKNKNNIKADNTKSHKTKIAGKVKNNAKHSAEQELEKIYEKNYKWLKAGKSLKRNNKDKVNATLKLILKLLIIGNIGIWSTLFLMVKGII
jgi:hypothetical protein